MTRAKVLLGHEWLHSFGSLLKCTYQSNTLAFEDYGVPVLLLGKDMFNPCHLLIVLN